MNRFLSAGRLSLNSLLAAAFLGAMAICVGAQAASIVVANPGFDAPVNQPFTFNSVSYPAGTDLPGGLYINQLDANGTGQVKRISDNTNLNSDDTVPVVVTATLSGWQVSGGGGIINGVVSFAPTDTVSGLTNVGQVGNLVSLLAPSSFSQTLPGDIQLLPLKTYVLSIELLKKPGAPLSTTFDADLTVGGTPLGGSLVYIAPTDSAPGSAVVTFSTGASPSSGDLGILISASGGSQILLDNVSLGTPEPASLGILALGSMMILARRHRNA